MTEWFFYAQTETEYGQFLWLMGYLLIIHLKVSKACIMHWKPKESSYMSSEKWRGFPSLLTLSLAKFEYVTRKKNICYLWVIVIKKGNYPLYICKLVWYRFDRIWLNQKFIFPVWFRNWKVMNFLRTAAYKNAALLTIF